MGINKIDFIAIDKFYYDIANKPEPASNFIPEWWKNASPYIKSPQNPDGKKLIISNSESNASFKKCQPMLDAISSGYIFTLHSDVKIEQVDGSPYISWRMQADVFSLHSHQEVEVPEGYDKESTFKFHNPWIPKLPKGYSALITSCIGYPNPIFKPISAIIDYDKSMHPLFPPMFIKSGFEGIVEKGTPMFQLIPFKRDNWESSFSYLENNEFRSIMARDVKATIVNNYIKNFWEKKNFK